MTSQSVSAWFLHKHWSGDTSATVYFFTAELGVVQALYKGGRTPKKQAMLQPFLPVWLSLQERHNRYYVQSVETDTSRLTLQSPALFSALYLNELVYYSLKPNVAEPEVFAAYVHTLYHLALTVEKSAIEALLRRFEWSLIQACGQYFSLSHEAETGHAINAERCYQYIGGRGMVLAPKGIPGDHLLALAADDLSQPDYLKSAKIVMRQAVDYLLGGREIKTRALYVRQ